MAGEIQIADKPTLDTINTNIGSNADAASPTGSIHAKLKNIQAGVTGLIGLSNIKSVQRGILESISAPVDITINAVDPNKAVVITSCAFSSGNNYDVFVYGYLANNTALTIAPKYTYNTWSDYPKAALAWQVVEFY